MVKAGKPIVPDIEKWEDYIEFPDLDKYDWKTSAEENCEFLKDGRLRLMPIFTGLFERLISFANMDGALIALIDEEQKPAVHRLFSRLCDFYDDLMYRYKKWYDADILGFHDDWGSQRAPFFSPDTCREMLLPYMKRVVNSAHKYGIFFEHHSCGKNEMLVPIMIETGADCWDGQDMNDKEMLYKKYGKNIRLGVKPNISLDCTDEEKIKEEVGKFLDTFGGSTAYLGQMRGCIQKVYNEIYKQSRIRYCL